ncbi:MULTISPECIES: MarR family transcriptional regulator [Salinibaculum]|uniref:MarR family transcriptional regulator n=1 Tax=Salinibaculum TaxID=2732368 RepID=UPI0030CBF59B
MKRFVAPLGFSGHLVTRSVIAHGIDAGHTITLVYPEQDEPSATERVKSAVNDVESTLTGVVHSVDLVEKTVPPDDFNAALDICSSILTDGQPPVVCMGGGATDVHLPMTVALLAHSEHITDVVMYSDTKQAATPVHIPDITATIPDETESTFTTLLSLLEEGNEVSVSDLAEAADVATSTASRHISTLADRDIVYRERSNQAKVVRLTTLGRLFSRNRM